MEEKILTQHPQGKKGVNISKAKYETIRNAIIAALEPDHRMTHDELTNALQQKLSGSFEGSIPWYTEVVKLDLEARNQVERLTDASPVQYRLTKST